MSRIIRAIERARASGPLHMTVLDPDEQSAERAAEIAERAVAVGSFGVMVGGSTGVTGVTIDETVRAIKQRTDAPVILLPSGSGALSAAADAVWWMSLLNSRTPRFLIREQARAARLLSRTKVEPIPLGYIVISPGMRVGEVGEADILARDDIEAAVGYALAAEYFGMRAVFLEAGSGAPEHVPCEMIAAVREACSILIVVGGGIREPGHAAAVAAAGADVVVTGNIVEQHDDTTAALSPIIEALRSTPRETFAAHPVSSRGRDARRRSGRGAARSVRDRVRARNVDPS